MAEKSTPSTPPLGVRYLWIRQNQPGAPWQLLSGMGVMEEGLTESYQRVIQEGQHLRVEELPPPRPATQRPPESKPSQEAHET
ncbi:MAG: hypothetical protein K6U87_09655 [Firmicutes bacterium]|nr:hypothetical protein [Bacillota bacterium]